MAEAATAKRERKEKLEDILVVTPFNAQVRHLRPSVPTLEDVFVELVGRSMADVERAHGSIA